MYALTFTVFKSLSYPFSLGKPGKQHSNTKQVWTVNDMVRLIIPVKCLRWVVLSVL
jgi:hypothetical protein